MRAASPNRIGRHPLLSAFVSGRDDKCARPRRLPSALSDSEPDPRREITENALPLPSAPDETPTSAAVSLDDGLDQRQAQAQAPSGPAGIGPIQAGPTRAACGIGIDADAGVAHRQRDEPVHRRWRSMSMRPSRPVYFDGVLDQIREHLTQTRPIADHVQVIRDVRPAARSPCHPPHRRRGRSLRRRRRPDRTDSRVSAIVPVSASRDVHQRRQRGAHAIRLFQGVRQPVARGVSVARHERRLGDVPKAGQRRPQVVRDVVERPAHAADQRLDPPQHLVDARAQLVERIARVPDRHARIEPPGLKNRAHRRLQRSQRCRPARVRRNPPTTAASAINASTSRPRARKFAEQLVSHVGASSHLNDHAVGQRHRTHFEHGAVGQAGDAWPSPELRTAGCVERRQIEAAPPRGAAKYTTSVRRFTTRTSSRSCRPWPASASITFCSPVRPGALVLDGVPRQHRRQRVVVLRGKRAREQHVVAPDSATALDDEQARVPQPEPERERAPDRPTPA